MENIPEDEVVIGGPESEDFCFVVAKWKARPYIETILKSTVCHPFFSLGLFTLSFAWPSIFFVDGLDVTVFSSAWTVFRTYLTDTEAARDAVKPFFATGAASAIGVIIDLGLNYKNQQKVDE